MGSYGRELSGKEDGVKPGEEQKSGCFYKNVKVLPFFLLLTGAAQGF